MRIFFGCFLSLSMSFGYSQETKLKSFSISECTENCQLQSHIEYVIEQNELLVSGLVKMNCCGSFNGSFEIIGSDTLNIIVDNNQDNSKKMDGCECVCSYSINLIISNWNQTLTGVLFNDETIEVNNKKGGIQKDIELK